MALSGHRKSMAIFIALGASLVALAMTLNISVIVLYWRAGVTLMLEILIGGLIIAGVVLNTIFLVREIRRNEQHDHFINAVTHELKTPVASIRLSLETLLTRDMDEGRRREFYQVMLSDNDRLTHTIDQVLRAGMVKATRRPVSPVPVELMDLTAECVTLARRRHHLAEDAIEFTGTPATVLGEADELKAAVSNLLDNAVKYSKLDVRVMVEVVRLDDKNAAVRVRDQGVGISGEELKRIFRRFYRIPGLVSMRVKGTGLGLYIVRMAAEKHGGRAYAQSEGPGRGSTFTLQLPLVS